MSAALRQVFVEDAQLVTESHGNYWSRRLCEIHTATTITRQRYDGNMIVRETSFDNGRTWAADIRRFIGTRAQTQHRVATEEL